VTKIVDSPEAAVADVRDGASLLVGGFGVAQNWPSSLLVALRDRGVRDLTLICNTPGLGRMSMQILGENGQVRKMIASYGGNPFGPTAIADRIATGEVEFELVPQGTLADRLRAGGAGLGGFFTPTGVGTDVAKGKEARTIGGQPMIYEEALRADVAFVRARAADPAGNLVYRGASRNFHPVFATAADLVVAEVDEIVALGDLDPENVVTPGIFVDRVVRATTAIPDEKVIAGVRKLARAEPEVGELPGLTPRQMAKRTAALFRPGEVVNLGIGIPTLCSNFIDRGAITLHSENGLLNYGPFPEEGAEDVHLYNAGGELVTTLPGASFVNSCDAFAMARTGRIDKVVLGGFQVAENGDFANWMAPHMKAGGIGGAMDLAAGKAELLVVMTHTSKDGAAKLLRRCTYPLTAIGCVSKVVTNLGLFEIDREKGFVLLEIAPGVTVDDVRAATDAEVVPAPDLREITL
jgi:3-oxoacid CoA-transferase